jgi:hypothetical protein
MSNGNKCIYNNKCLFAHNLDEQTIDHTRILAYNIIKKNEDCTKIDLTKNTELYEQLLSLSKLCELCAEGSCTGGYNCKHGACNVSFIVCKDDLYRGICTVPCTKQHLSTKGLIPYGRRMKMNAKARTLPNAIILNDIYATTIEQLDIKIDKSCDDVNSYSSDDSDNVLFINIKTLSDDEFDFYKTTNKRAKLTKSIFNTQNIDYFI